MSTSRSSRKTASILALITVILMAAAPPATAAITWQSTGPTVVYIPQGPGGAPGADYYSYAPSVIQDSQGMTMWTCHNTVSGVIEDDIVATRIQSGVLVSNDSALSAAPSGWDSFHICDPSVIRVDAVMDNVRYSYAMFYLGNDVNASAHNQVGVAFSHSLAGPWVRWPDPIVEFSGTNLTAWGAGQPSATAIDPLSGTALLFWTEGYGAASTTKTYRATVDLDGGSGPVLGTPVQVTAAGLTGTDLGADWLNGADFAYDPVTDRFLAVRERHPYPTDDPDYIGAELQVASIDGTSIWAGGGTWTVEGNIGAAQTGMARNHNAGLIRSEYGTLPVSGEVSVVFTVTCGACSDSLWHYELWRLDGTL